MSRVIKGDGKISFFVGWMLSMMAFLALIAVIVLTFVIETWFLIFLFGPILLLIGAWVNFHFSSRSRLKITPEGFDWRGPFGRTRSIAWRDLDRILLPAPGSHPRLAAAARLKDSRIVEIEALWFSRANLWNTLTPPDHTEAQRALIDGHKAYLARTS